MGHGPSSSHVEEVEARLKESAQAYAGFAVRR